MPLAQRPLRPALRRHARPVGRRRAGLPGRDRRRPGRRRRRRPSPTGAAICCTASRRGWSRASPWSSPRPCSACSTPACPPRTIVRTGVEFGTRYREAGWGAGLTVLTAMANVLPDLDPADRALALVHGLAFVSRDTRGRAAAVPVAAARRRRSRPSGWPSWYRRFVETRSADAAERTLASAIATARPARPSPTSCSRRSPTTSSSTAGTPSTSPTRRSRCSTISAGSRAPDVLPTLVAQTAAAEPQRGAGCVALPARPRRDDRRRATAALPGPPGRRARGATASTTTPASPALAWSILADDPAEVVDAPSTTPIVAGADARGARPGGRLRRRRCASPASTPRTTTATGTRCTTRSPPPTRCTRRIGRAPSPELLRGVYHGALRVYLDRFLNVPAARLPELAGHRRRRADLAELQALLGPGGPGRRGRRDRLPPPAPAAAIPRRRSPRSVTRC